MSRLIVVACPMHKIATVTVNVSVVTAENGLKQIPVEFEVFVDNQHYMAVPVMTKEVQELTHLPKVLHFNFTNCAVFEVSQQELVNEIVAELKKLMGFADSAVEVV